MSKDYQTDLEKILKELFSTVEARWNEAIFYDKRKEVINYTIQEVTKLFTDLYEQAKPRRMKMVEYKHVGFLSETGLEQATHNVKAIAHNDCLDTFDSNMKKRLEGLK